MSMAKPRNSVHSAIPPRTVGCSRCARGGSATSAEPVELSPVTLRGPPRATITFEVRSEDVALGRRRAVVDVALDGNRGTHPFDDGRDHLEDSCSIVQVGLDPIARRDRASPAWRPCRSPSRARPGTPPPHRCASWSSEPTTTTDRRGRIERHQTAGTCWVMQWMPPPPAARTAPTSRAIVSRPGYCSAITASMSTSASCPHVGTMTNPLPT